MKAGPKRRQRKNARVEHERLLLTDRDSDAFLAAVKQQPAPAARLVSALRRHTRQS